MTKKIKIIGALFTFVLTISVFYSFLASASTSLRVPRMSPSIQTSVFTGTLDMSSFDNYSVRATATYIVNANGELWGYIAGNTNNPNTVVSGLVLTDVIAFTSSTVASRSIRGTGNLYPDTLSGLTLKSDGTVWLTRIGVNRNNHELDVQTLQIGSSVSKISSTYYLTESGNLYTFETNRNRFNFIEEPESLNFGGTTVFVGLVARDIIDTANGVHLPSNRILELSGARIERVQELFAVNGATFALTKEGRLYGWGVHTTGRVGAGPVFDRAMGVMGDWWIAVNRPRRILDNVVTVSSDDNLVFAIDTNGRLWEWGGAVPAIPGGGATVIWGNEEQLRPRLSSNTNPIFSLINGVTILADGSLTVQSIDETNFTNQITHNVRLPIRFSNILGSNGVQPGTTNPPVVQPEPPVQQPQPPVSSGGQPSSWAVEQVNRAIGSNLVPQHLQSGYTQPITRAEFAALGVALYEASTGRTITARMQFNDTNDINVQQMGALGVVSGVGNGNFAPNDTITREQAAVMLARLAAAMDRPLPAAQNTFVDNNQISSWAFEAVGQVQAAGIMGGVGNNTFDPRGTFTREQSIITMLRLFELR